MKENQESSASRYELMPIPFRFENAHKGVVKCSAVNIRKRELYTGDADGIIKAWDYATFEFRFQIGGKDVTGSGVEGHKGAVTVLEYSEKMGVLFSASLDGELMGWLLRQNTDSPSPRVCSSLSPLGLTMIEIIGNPNFDPLSGTQFTPHSLTRTAQG